MEPRSVRGHYSFMSVRKTSDASILQSGLRMRGADELHWIDVFKDRITEDLKRVLQEDMDWMTSLPILERLNRLREIEEARRNQEHFREPGTTSP
jgi:hypothetical protein